MPIILKVMIGCAPDSKRVADEIGADAYDSDAGQAIELARSLMLVKTTD